MGIGDGRLGLHEFLLQLSLGFLDLGQALLDLLKVAFGAGLLVGGFVIWSLYECLLLSVYLLGLVGEGKVGICDLSWLHRAEVGGFCSKFKN